MISDFKMYLWTHFNGNKWLKTYELFVRIYKILESLKDVSYWFSTIGISNYYKDSNVKNDVKEEKNIIKKSPTSPFASLPIKTYFNIFWHFKNEFEENRKLS